MQQLVIDCRSGKQQFIELSTQEEADRLEEIEKNKQALEAEKEKVIKDKLSNDLAELEQMQKNKDVFTDEDIAKKQADIDKLKSTLI